MIRLSEVTGRIVGPTFSPTMPVGDEQTDDHCWDALGDHAFDPVCVPMLEALRWIGEPLSAIELVDVLDGYVSMWEAASYLEALQEIGVTEPTSLGPSSKRTSEFEVSFRLKAVAGGSD